MKIKNMIECEDLLHMERQHVVGLRGKELQRVTAPEDLFGLALSGGGIRSATFSLGVIQALAEKKLLHKIDYISGVSGGNYIGAWLSACINEEKKLLNDHDKDKAFSALYAFEEKLNPNRPSTQQGDYEPREVRFLRAFSSYLTPRLGLLSGDTLSLLAGSLRNLVLNIILFIMLVFFIIAFLHELVPILQYFGSETFKPAALSLCVLSIVYVALCLTLQSFDISLLPPAGKIAYRNILSRPYGVLFFVIAPSILFDAIWLSSPQNNFTPIYGNMKLTFLFCCSVFLGITTAYIFAYFTSEKTRWYQLLKQALWKNIFLILFSILAFTIISEFIIELQQPLWSKFSGNIHSINVYTISFGPILIMLEIWLLYLVWMLFAGGLLSDYTREWLNRLFGYLSSGVIAWALIGVLSIYTRPLILWLAYLLPDKLMHNAQFIFAGIGTSLLIIFLIYSTWIARAANGPTNATSAAPKLGFHKFIETITTNSLVILIFAFHIVIYQYFVIYLFDSNHDMIDIKKDIIVNGQDVFFSDFVKLHITNINCALSLQPQLGCKSQSSPAYTFLPFIVLFFLAVLAFAFVDVNVFSIQNLYRNRLVRCYLGAANRCRYPEPFAGFDRYDDFELSHIADQRPYLISNAALNISRGQALAWQQRKAASFIFSPLWCGYWLSPTEADINSYDEASSMHSQNRGGYINTEDYVNEAVNFGKKSKGITIGTAMATSGAAVSSQMGYASHGARAFFITLLNLRMGRWLPNPVKKSQNLWAQQSPRFSLKYYLSELLGITTERSEWIYISDGGHFENLGIYELVRRRCKRIICVDAGADPARTFEDLGNALQKCRVDLGVEIMIDTQSLTINEEGKSSTGFVIGTVHYPSLPNSSSFIGNLIYIKPSLSAQLNLPVDILSYKARHPEFPHEPTRNQWFSETQFESYRKLGYLLGVDAFGDTTI